MRKRNILQALWLVLLTSAAILIIRARMHETPRYTEIAVPSATPAAMEAAFANVQTITITLAPSGASAPPATREPTPAPIPTPFSIFWMSDTQYYSYAVPSVFSKMTDWMAGQVDAYNAQCVVHTGDIVDNHNLDKHWKNAETAIRKLSGKLPLLCVAGNHDVGADTVDYTEYFTYGFCDVTQRDDLYYGGVCWIYPFQAGGTDFVIVGIGWQQNRSYLPWVIEKLEEYAESTAILLVHDFLTDDGELSANGIALERELVAVCPNIKLVLCGHNDGASQWSKTYTEDARTVNALMYNFQDDKKNGLGYMRILTFIPQTHTIGVVTYSPYLDDYSYFSDEGRDMFVLFNAY